MHDFMIIGVVALVTVLIRAFPFLVLKDKHSSIIKYLGDVLPYPIMAMLIIYCLKDVNLFGAYHGISEIIAIVSVILLHICKRNTLLSIFGGTITYMICVQLLFV